MRSMFIIILICFICSSQAVFKLADSAEDLPAVSAPAIRPGYENHSAVWSGSGAEGARPGSLVPVYLGRTSTREPARLGGRFSGYGDLSGARWSPTWPYNQTLMQKGRFVPASEPVGIEEYHVPSIVEFLRPDWNPVGFNYSYYVPSLGEFANASWTPPQTNYSLHVPSLGAFLSPDWQPRGPNAADYPPWVMEYLHR